MRDFPAKVSFGTAETVDVILGTKLREQLVDEVGLCADYKKVVNAYREDDKSSGDAFEIKAGIKVDWAISVGFRFTISPLRN